MIKIKCVLSFQDSDFQAANLKTVRLIETIAKTLFL
jgi:hypothetical protein